MAPRRAGTGRDHREGKAEAAARSRSRPRSGLIVEDPEPDQDAIAEERDCAALRLPGLHGNDAIRRKTPCRRLTIAWTFARFIFVRGDIRATSAATLSGEGIRPSDHRPACGTPVAAQRSRRQIRRPVRVHGHRLAIVRRIARRRSTPRQGWTPAWVKTRRGFSFADSPVRRETLFNLTG